MTQAPLVLPLGDCQDIRLVGGKAINLARLIVAGFPVPDGFVVTTVAFRQAMRDGVMSAELTAEIAAAYQRLGAPVVAVRSSATAEDLAGASMAGQYETFLDLSGEAEVIAAIGKCWASLHTDRTRTYLAEHGIDGGEVAMAVVVQQLVPADIAGVLFTANPRTGSQQEMLIEASWGLGEAVVSGIVQPDTLVLDRANGTVKTATISDKHVWIASGSHEVQPVPMERRHAPSLNSRQVHDLWHLGLRTMAHFGSAQDLEWAIAGDQLYLLQSRAITTLEDAETREQCLRETRKQLRQWHREGRGDWVRHNIAETLPHPTPLTWSVIRRFMSGDGGYGGMYKTVGFEPSPTVRSEGVLELVAGRIYMDLALAPEMFFSDFPYRYDLELLASNPDAAQGPPTRFAGPLWRRFRTGRKLTAVNRKIEELARTCDQDLDRQIIPALIAYVREEKTRDLTCLTTAEWLAVWRQREQKVLDEFAPRSLLPSLIAAMATEKLRAFLEEHFWDEEPLELANLLPAGGEPDLTLCASQGLYEIAQGISSVTQWLETNGHRAPQEFDLAAPRWREQPAALNAIVARLKDGISPFALHKRRGEQAARRLAELQLHLSWSARRELEEHLALVRRYMRFREDGKHYLMLGYDLLRDMVLEAARRLDLDGDVFLLSLEDLCDALGTGFAPLHLIEQRRLVHAVESKISLPDVITQADVESLGQPPQLPEGDRLAAFPLSAGVCSGPVRIVLSPQQPGNLSQGYVLVCPSTDPSWTPLFVNAAGLVLECGGTLSHGAVVAREMGIPAVVHTGATRFLEEGEIIGVDGHRGTIIRRASEADGAAAPPVEIDPQDTHIPRELVPPAPGSRERRSARLRNWFLLGWTVFFLVAFLLPGTWMYDSCMQAMDALLWPAIAAWGKPVAVALAASGLAAATMICQRLLTDNHRLRVAKQRANTLRKLAANLPKDSPRQKAYLQLAAPVQTRIVLAAMVPLAVLLGPMVISFMWWFPARVDPVSWNPRPGATANVVATIDGEYLGPITLQCEDALRLEAATPAVQSLLPIRQVLEDHRAKWQQQSDLTNQPWELQEAGRRISQALVADLSEYLKHDLPPQTLSWTLRTPTEKAGRFAVALNAAQGEVLHTHLVVGDNFPPQPKEDLGDGKAFQVVRPAGGDSPVRQIKVVYSEQKQRGHNVFWAPFAARGWPEWDLGWLWTYILSYLPVMFLFRWVLRIP